MTNVGRNFSERHIIELVRKEVEHVKNTNATYNYGDRITIDGNWERYLRPSAIIEIPINTIPQNGFNISIMKKFIGFSYGGYGTARELYAAGGYTNPTPAWILEITVSGSIDGNTRMPHFFAPTSTQLNSNFSLGSFTMPKSESEMFEGKYSKGSVVSLQSPSHATLYLSNSTIYDSAGNATQYRLSGAGTTTYQLSNKYYNFINTQGYIFNTVPPRGTYYIISNGAYPRLLKYLRINTNSDYTAGGVKQIINPYEYAPWIYGTGINANPTMEEGH